MKDAHIQSVVVYDGECAFCLRQISRIRRKDTHGRFAFVSKQTPGIEDRFPQLAQSDFNTGMRLIAPDGRIFVGADAVYHIARDLPFLRRVAWLYRVPGLQKLARWAYAWVAARRYRLAKTCEDGECSKDPA